MTVYTVLPITYLLINSTKNIDDFFRTFGLTFGSSFSLWDNLVSLFTVDNGIYLRWLLNTVFYAVVGGGGAAIISTLAGYGIAKYSFKGRKAIFAITLGAIAIPGTALALPTFLLASEVSITNTPWAVIIPALVNPFGMYLMWIYTSEAVPDELLEAARIDGAGELRIFRVISLRLLAPGFVTVLLFSVTASWNNYFLPLLMLNDPKWYPLTVGLADWNAQTTGSNPIPLQNLVLTGSLVAIIPIVVAFLSLQKYWQSGLAAGGVKQ